MIGIEAIGTYMPRRRIDNRDRLDLFGIDEQFLTSKTGMLSLACKSAEEETSDLCCRAYEDLANKSPLSERRPDCVIVVTQNPDGLGLPHTSAILHSKLQLPSSCAAFDVSLGCSGFVYGLSVIQSFMTGNGFKTGILFTADPYSKIIDMDDKNTSLLFGDAATATLIGSDPVWRTGRFLFGTQGADGKAIQTSVRSGNLEMNGRAVFSFTATVVPQHIRDMLGMNEVEIGSVDRFLLHQGSRFIIDTLRKRLGIPDDKVPFDATEYGNTISSSIPLLLEKVGEEDGLLAIAGFGVGLSWASTVLFRAR